MFGVEWVVGRVVVGVSVAIEYVCQCYFAFGSVLKHPSMTYRFQYISKIIEKNHLYFTFSLPS